MLPVDPGAAIRVNRRADPGARALAAVRGGGFTADGDETGAKVRILVSARGLPGPGAVHESQAHAGGGSVAGPSTRRAAARRALVSGRWRVEGNQARTLSRRTRLEASRRADSEACQRQSPMIRVRLARHRARVRLASAPHLCGLLTVTQAPERCRNRRFHTCCTSTAPDRDHDGPPASLATSDRPRQVSKSLTHWNSSGTSAYHMQCFDTSAEWS